MKTASGKTKKCRGKKRTTIIRCKVCKSNCRKCSCKKKKNRSCRPIKKRYALRNCSQFVFTENVHRVHTADTMLPLPLNNISHSTQYVYSVKNIDDHDAEVEIQVGPDKNSLAHDLGPQLIPANETVIVTPLRFSKYICLRYRSAEPGKSTRLVITFQAQLYRNRKICFPAK